MSSLVKSLAQRNIAGGVGVSHILSLESAAVDAQSDVVQNIEQLHEATQEIVAHGDDAHKAAVLGDGIDTLVDNTIDAYKDSQIDERGAELLRVSVECLIRAAGLPLHVDAVVPSFENAKRGDYSTEAEVKKKGIIARLVAFLRESWQRLVAVVRRWIAHLKGSSDSLVKYVAAVKARTTNLQGAAKDRKIKLAPKVAQNLVDLNGHAQTPDKAIHNSIAIYARYVGTVQSSLGKVAKVPPLSFPTTDEKVNLWDNHMSTELGDSATTGLKHLASIVYLPGRKFEVKHTEANGSMMVKGNLFTPDRSHTVARPLIGATVSVSEDHPKSLPTEIAVLSVQEIHATVSAAEAAITDIKQVEDIVAKWISASDVATKILANIEKGVAAEPVQTPAHANNLTVFRSVMAANEIYGKAYTLTIPHAIELVRTNLTIADKCISYIKHGEIKEVKAEKAAAQPRVGHDHKEEEHEYTDFEPVH